jgi:hypothetical protein
MQVIITIVWFADKLPVFFAVLGSGGNGDFYQKSKSKSQNLRFG